MDGDERDIVCRFEVCHFDRVVFGRILVVLLLMSSPEQTAVPPEAVEEAIDDLSHGSATLNAVRFCSGWS